MFGFHSSWAMVFLKRILPLICIFLPLAFPQETGPLIIEINEEVDSRCRSWRVAGEANNLSPWKTIPKECADYVRKYITGNAYQLDLQIVYNEASIYATTLNFTSHPKIAWIFDIDETLLSNIPYYTDHGYGLEVFDSTKFDEWVEMGMAPAIDSTLKLYQEVLSLGFKIIFLTGRSERHRNITMENLSQAGFPKWDKLILRSSEDHGKTATRFKSEKRRQVLEEGFEIGGNCGDQWSDLLGSSMSIRSFKLPNPMYYIA